MFGRLFMVAAMLLGVAFSGCIDDESQPDLLPATGLAPELAGGWRLDCTMGDTEPPTWLQDCMARASHTYGPKAEVWLAINPTDPDNVVMAAKDNNPENSNDCTWNGVYVTHDGGDTWTDVVIGGPYAEREPDSPYYGYACNTDPMFVFGVDGKLHYNVELYNLGGEDGAGPLGAGENTGRATVLPSWKSVLATSHDGGLTWPDAVVQTTGDGLVQLVDYSHMGINPATGSIFTAINGFDGTGFTTARFADETGALSPGHITCHVIVSRDGGQSTEPPVIVAQSPSEEDPKPDLYCFEVVGSPEGTMVLLLYGGDLSNDAADSSSGAIHIWRSVSLDDGESWSMPETTGLSYTPAMSRGFEENRFRNPMGMEAEYDETNGPHQGRLYHIFPAYDTDSPGEDDYTNIQLVWSKDDGATWSEPVRVNQGGFDHDQWMPNIAVAGDGSVHACWMDKRHDPENRLIDLYHGVSLDGGATWSEQRVSTHSYDGDLGVHQEGFPFFGDYIGVDAVGDTVWCGVPESSNGASTLIAGAKIVRAA